MYFFVPYIVGVFRCWQKDSTWPHLWLCSACPEDQTPTAVDLTPGRPGSSPCVAPPSPPRLRQKQTPSSCRESSTHGLCWGRASSGVCSSWPTRRFSLTCMRRWRWRPRLERLISMCWTFRCLTCTLPSGYRKRRWSGARMWFHFLLTYEHLRTLFPVRAVSHVLLQEGSTALLFVKPCTIADHEHSEQHWQAASPFHHKRESYACVTRYESDPWYENLSNWIRVWGYWWESQILHYFCTICWPKYWKCCDIFATFSFECAFCIWNNDGDLFQSYWNCFSKQLSTWMSNKDWWC